MPRKYLGTDVFNQAIDRMRAVYAEGHRVVVSFSAGKDSCCTLNVCRIAATEEGRLPVEVVMQDEEIAFPGTYEYAERIAKDPDIDFNWLVMQQPMINIFNREAPYWWCHDPLLPPEKWVRPPPPFAKFIPEKEISQMTVPWRFPPPEGKKLVATIGLRIQESWSRMYGLFSSGGYLTKPNKWGVVSARPIYDWSDDDVWKAIKDNGWDYNHAYNTLHNMGVPRRLLRIGPPTMNTGGITNLSKAAAAWPQWFAKVADRLPGVRTAAKFGARSCRPDRGQGETWEQCFQRECIDNAPKWVAARAIMVRDSMLSSHHRHSTAPFPEVKGCYTCGGSIGSWRQMALAMWGGDPFSSKTSWLLDWVEPEFFRPGAGTWLRDGSPEAAAKAKAKAEKAALKAAV